MDGEVRVASRGRSSRCAYCHEGLGEGELTQCEGCHASFHPECRTELDRCPTLGCEQEAAVSVVIVSPREIELEPPTRSAIRALYNRSLGWTAMWAFFAGVCLTILMVGLFVDPPVDDDEALEGVLGAIIIGCFGPYCLYRAFMAWTYPDKTRRLLRKETPRPLRLRVHQGRCTHGKSHYCADFWQPDGDLNDDPSSYFVIGETYLPDWLTEWTPGDLVGVYGPRGGLKIVQTPDGERLHVMVGGDMVCREHAEE